MSTPFRRLIGASYLFKVPKQCLCRRHVSPQRTLSSGQVREISSCAPWWSGHSKWASIKHDKGKADAAKSKMRAIITKDISNAVKLGGPDPNMNPRLALAIAKAKQTATPKASIEAAIARGQGLSASGAALESVVVEAMLPPSIATVIECQTDNKLRLLSDLRLMIKEAGGSVSAIGYMFEKKGRIILQKKESMGADEVLDHAIELGVLDVIEDDQGRVVLYTEPAQTSEIADLVAKALEVEIEESEIIWDPNEDTKMPLDNEEAAQRLSEFLDELQDQTGIQGVYMNLSKGTIPEELWSELQSKLTA
ncbi:YebC-like protein [Amniculicola lignicola CBS 123094]|uniref:YebC-like protein n=1 Tax=Amniculicola lignicola CBS 123094 TaxID=1392246 RepID=A0A6A5WL78_9PLEO|nr:YebC-like protein [Amniculicola lignicola CBS 123094]